MELLYIYIENDRRNIKDCEFNFSSQYRFHYDKSTNTCHKEELSNYIPNFWGANNIRNITAIVGKNGTGKSNLIEFLSLALCGGLKGGYRHLIIWKSNEVLFSNKQVYNSFDLHTDRTLYAPLANIADKGITNTLLMYFSSNIDRKITSNSKTKNFIDISTANLLRHRQITDKRRYYFPDIEYLQIKDTFNQILFFNSFNNVFLPDDITIPEYLNITLFARETNAQHPTYQHLLNEQEEVTFEKKLRNILLCQIFSQNVPAFWDVNTPLSEVMGTISSSHKDTGLSFYDELMVLYSQGAIICKLNQLEGLRKWTDFTFSIHRTALNNKNFTAIVDYYKEVGFNNASFTSIKSTNHINNNCIIKWNGLSSGELAFFNLLSRIFSELTSFQGEIYSYNEHKVNVQDRSKYKNVILILDEPELSFHPEWQRLFLKLLIQALCQNFNKFNFQIIIASHSPIVVSDFPNDNIIFLNKTKDGYCKVENSAMINKTFGANIYSLYKHSFFIDLPMGEFAKSKIENIQLSISNHEFNQNIYKQIQLIGEPIIRNILTKLYNEKKKQHVENSSKEEKIKLLEEELARLRQNND